MSFYRITEQEDQRHVFVARTAPTEPVEVGENWIDLYAILQVPPRADARDIEEAIVGRTAECLCFAFSRSSVKPDSIQLIEEHQDEFRPVLLHPETRRRYDELLAQHRGGDASVSYENFLGTVGRDSMQGCLTGLIMIFSAAFMVALPFAYFR